MSQRRVVCATAPGAIGPYSQAVAMRDTLYVSGCIGVRAEDGEFPSDSVVEQTRQALVNMREIVKAGGAVGLEAVVKTTVLLVDMNDYAAVNAVYAEFFPPDQCPPARAAFAVVGLPKGARVEIDAIATLAV